MAHIYLTFDFGKDEEKAQQARHKLDSWKQAFRLDKKMQGKFERKEDGPAAVSAPVAEAKPEKKAAAKGAKGKAKAEPEPAKLAPSNAEIKLILRLALPNHEKLTEQRILKRISSEEPLRALRRRRSVKGMSDLARWIPGFRSWNRRTSFMGIRGVPV